MYLKLAIIFVILFHLISCDSKISDFKSSFIKNCTKFYTMSCFKLDIASWIDKIDRNESISVLPGISIIRLNDNYIHNNNVTTPQTRDFSDDSSHTKLDNFLIKKILNYLNNHSIRLSLNEPRKSSGMGGGGGGGKKGYGMELLLAGAAMMKGTLIALTLAGITTMAGKALVASLVSLMISSFSGIKQLAQSNAQTTYEVVAKPTSHEDFGYSGYSRNYEVLPIPIKFKQDLKHRK